MNIALLLSGGVGTRIKSEVPKQYIEVGGRPVISYCIERLSLHKQIDALWIVADSAVAWAAYGGGWKSMIRGKNAEDFPRRERTGSYLFCMDLRIYAKI